MSARDSLGHRAARAVVGVLLLLYPPRFRRRFGPRMLETFDHRCREVARRGRMAVLGLVARTAWDLVRSAAREWARPASLAAAGRDPAAPSDSTNHGIASLMDHLMQDLRFALRSLWRRPGFTLVAVLTLGLGIGANTAIFSVVNGVLLRPLPFPEPESLAMVWSHDLEEPEGRGYMSQPDLEDVRELETVASVEGVSSGACTLTGMGAAERVPCTRVTGSLLRTFRLPPALGRDIRHEENRSDAPRVVLLSHDFWMDRFGGDPGVVGRTLEISERPHEIVGVAPPGFDYPDRTRLWVPYRIDMEDCGSTRGCHVYRAVARIDPGVGMEAAAADLDRLARVLGQEHPDSNEGTGLRFESLTEHTVGDVRAGLWVVLGAVGAVLLIACANVANLLLVRASTRRGEVAVRAALGAGRRRLMGQVLVESLVLAGMGAGVGLALAYGGVGLIEEMAPEGIPRMEEVAVDGTVLLFAVGVTGLVALLFGLAPALSVAGTSVIDHLGAGTGRGRRAGESRSRSALLAVEVGLSLVLLVGSGLLLRTMSELNRVELGFDGREVVRFGLNLPSARYGSLPTIVPFYRELEARLGALPQVEEVGSAFGAPFTGGEIMGGVTVEGRSPSPDAEDTYGAMRPVTPGYVPAMGLRLLRGRGIEPTDGFDSSPVAVVSETFARQNFPDQDPLGKRFRVSASFGYNNPTWTVVGVVADVRRGVTAEPRPEVYVPHAQYGPGSMTVHVRGRPGADDLLADARRVVAELDPNLPLANVETMEEAVRKDMATPRFYLTLVGVFALVAVVLAAVGLYGVVAYLISRRTREIGIRMALGAHRTEIVRLVMRQGVTPIAWGVALGLGVAFLGSRVMEAVLFQVEPVDPVVFGVSTLIIGGVAVVATLLPARRAARVEPSEALRTE